MVEGCCRHCRGLLLACLWTDQTTNWYAISSKDSIRGPQFARARAQPLPQNQDLIPLLPIAAYRKLRMALKTGSPHCFLSFSVQGALSQGATKFPSFRQNRSVIVGIQAIYESQIGSHSRLGSLSSLSQLTFSAFSARSTTLSQLVLSLSDLAILTRSLSSLSQLMLSARLSQLALSP